MQIDPETLEIVYPIVWIEVYDGGVKLVRKCQLPERNYNYARRSTITELTPKSLSRLAWLVTNTSVEFCSILTLTYGIDWPKDGREMAAHRNAILTNMRRWYSGLEYVWILEFQTRGAPHLHVILSLPLEITSGDRVRLASSWSSLVCPRNDVYTSPKNGKTLRKRDAVKSVHLHPKTWEKIRKKRGTQRYIMSYALKPEQKKKPSQYKNVGRFWGASKGVKEAVKIRHRIDVTGHEEARKYLEHMGRDDLAGWEVLPQLCFKKRSEE